MHAEYNYPTDDKVLADAVGDGQFDALFEKHESINFLELGKISASLRMTLPPQQRREFCEGLAIE